MVDSIVNARYYIHCSLHSILYPPWRIPDTLHSILCTLKCIAFAPHHILYTWCMYPLCYKVHILYCTFFIKYSTLYTVCPMLRALHSTPYTHHSTLHTIFFWLYTLYSSLYDLQYTFYNLYYILRLCHFYSTWRTPYYNAAGSLYLEQLGCAKWLRAI